MPVKIDIKWADNTADLAKHLKEGTDAIVATKAGAESLVKSFSGDKLIAAAHRMVAAIDEVGGAEKLTNAERERTNALLDKAIQKYAVLGKEAPSALKALELETRKVEDATKKLAPATDDWGGAMQKAFAIAGVGFGAAAIVGGIKNIVSGAFQAADQVHDLSEKLGVSTDAVQRWAYAAKQTGADISNISVSLGFMNKSLDGGSDSTVAALKSAGLQFQTIRNLSPEQAFETIAEAIRKIPDPMLQARVATELFGKSGQELLPAIKEGLVQIGNQAPITSEAVINAMESGGDAIDRFWTKVTAQTQTSVGTVLLTIEELGKGWKGLEHLSAIGLFNSDEEFIAKLMKIREGENALTDATKKTIEESVRNGEANELLAIGLTGTTEAIYKYADSLRKAGTAHHDTAKDARDQAAALAKAKAAQEAWAVVLAEVNSAGEDFEATILGIDGAIVPWAEHLLASGVSASTVAKYYGLTDTQVKALEKDVAAATKAAAEWDVVFERLTTHAAAKAIPAFTGLTMTWQQMLNTGKGLTYDGLVPMAKGFDDVSRAELALKRYTDDLTKSRVALQNQLASTIGLMPDLSGLAKDHMKEFGTEAGHDFTGAFGSALDALPETLRRAFEGGGGMAGAAKSIGTQLANDVVQAYADRMKAAGHPLTKSQTAAISAGTAGATTVGGAMGGPTGGMIAGVASGIGGAALAASSVGAGMAAAGVGGAIALGAATMGIGAAAVGVYMLAKHFLTVSQHEKDARVEFQKLQDLYGSLPATIDAVGKVYADMGYSGEEAQAAIQRALDATHESAEAEDAALRPIVAILADAETRAQTLTTGIDAITEAGRAFGGTVPDQFRAAVTQLAAMKGVTDDQRKALLGMTAEVKPNFEALTQTAAKYGVTLEGLGKSFQQANLEGRAKAISGDFDALTKAGGDAGGILAGMADEISALVADSKKFGTAIPENMRPLIDELLRAGKLTDENGDKLEDVSDISFEATPIDESLTKLSDAIDKLTASLTDLTHMHIPPIVVPVTYDTSGAPTTQPASFAEGSDGFQDFGAGTLAVLHGREAVVTEGQARSRDYRLHAAASGVERLQAGTTTITVHVSTIDAADFQTVTEQKILPAIVAQLRGGRGLTPMQDALGIR